MFVYHGRSESKSADLAEGHEEALHGAVRVGEVVRVARGAVVEAAHGAERGARRQHRARRRLQLPLRAALRHAHAQQLRLVAPRHAAHGGAVLAGHQVLHVGLRQGERYCRAHGCRPVPIPLLRTSLPQK